MSSLPEASRPLIRFFAAWDRRFGTMGLLSLAAFAFAVVTGIVLTAGYDASSATASLALLELSSPAGRFVRGLHAWSSHLLLVLTALHAVDHLASATDRRLARGVWMRLVLAIPLLFGLMLSGFMLRGDAEGELARRVVAGLLEEVLGVGAAAAAALLGAGDDLQIVYVHHVATLTLLVGVAIVEHGRRVWPGVTSVAAVAALAAGLAWLAPPSLHDGVDPVVRGPWYFLAMQELLHWLPEPAWLWCVVLAPLVALWFVPRLEERGRRRVLRVLLALLACYLLVGVFAALFRGPGYDLVPPWRAARQPSRAVRPALAPATWAAVPETDVRTVRGRPEGCVACHAGVEGLGPSHDPAALGCSSCHLGNPFAADAQAAHAGLVLVPGNLDTAALTCGAAGCHDSVLARVQGSLMTTVRGMIAVDRWAFGEQRTPDGHAAVVDLGDSPADTHLRQMCVTCHLGYPKLVLGPVVETTRGGGCAACHVRYPEERTYKRDNPARFTHPAVSAQVSDESCFGCHSRSGRISLSYAGWWDAGLTDAEAERLPAGATRRLADGRILVKASADAHHEKGLACIDCHTAQETMGDGRMHLHEEQATRVRCETCHRATPASSLALAELPAEPRAVVRLRYGDAAPARYLVEDASGEILTNAWPLADGSIELRGKLSGKRHVARPPARACRGLRGHERLSCRSCHETWVTRCVACHTQWDPRGGRTDILSGEQRAGSWVEYDAGSTIGVPIFGVLERDGRASIEPFAPGMIMTINQPGSPAPSPLPEVAAALVGPRTRFLRAFALAVPHTTARAGLACASCHRDPEALGYGKGKLALVKEQAAWRWRFDPLHEASSFDGLPLDAWIGFLDGQRRGVATRAAARPLNVEEQLRVLEVGACLGCHDPATPAGTRIYATYRESRARLAPPCRLPSAPGGAR